jgi:hypothetical protein
MEHFLTYPEKLAGIVDAFVISARGLTADVAHFKFRGTVHQGFH